MQYYDGRLNAGDLTAAAGGQHQLNPEVRFHQWLMLVLQQFITLTVITMSVSYDMKGKNENLKDLMPSAGNS